MLDRPDLPDVMVHAALHRAYGVRVASLHFLPLGADTNIMPHLGVA